MHIHNLYKWKCELKPPQQDRKAERQTWRVIALTLVMMVIKVSAVALRLHGACRRRMAHGLPRGRTWHGGIRLLVCAAPQQQPQIHLRHRQGRGPGGPTKPPRAAETG
jgi:hypothetical protein